LIGNGTVAGATVNIGALSNFTWLIASAPTGASISISIVQASSVAGSFGTLVAVYTGPSSSCFSLGTPTQSSITTSLTVAAAVMQLCSGSLSTGAIVGIAVGCGVAAIVLVAVPLAFYNRKRHAQKESAMAQLRKGNEEGAHVSL
jgi:hypothetical protein